MNLTQDPWITVLRKDGRPDTVNLTQVFVEGDELADLIASPVERIAWMRLFLAIAHAALNGPQTKKDIEDDVKRLPKAAEAYLKKWKASFNLFDAKIPFLQRAGLEAKNRTELSKLDFSLATGNNATLFDNAANASSPRAFANDWIARKLVAFQCFSPGGLIGEATLGKTTTPGGRFSSHAPCTPYAMLHCFILGENLSETICRNLLPFDSITTGGDMEIGRPYWETPPQGFSDKEHAVENATKTYLGRLVPLTRSILIGGENKDMILANGLDYPGFPDFPREASTAEKIVGKENKSMLVKADPDRAIWRELHSICMANRGHGPGGIRALGLIDEEQNCRLWTGALVTDQASIIGTVESIFSIAPSIRTDVGRSRYESEVKFCEKLDFGLVTCCKDYRRAIDPSPNQSPEANLARRTFWTRIESSLDALNHWVDSGSDADFERWRTALRKNVQDAYASACPSDTPRRLAAFVKAGRKLNGFFNEKSPTI